MSLDWREVENLYRKEKFLFFNSNVFSYWKEISAKILAQTLDCNAEIFNILLLKILQYPGPFFKRRAADFFVALSLISHLKSLITN